MFEILLGQMYIFAGVDFFPNVLSKVSNLTDKRNSMGYFKIMDIFVAKATNEADIFVERSYYNVKRKID